MNTPVTLTKRNGEKALWEIEKIVRAIALALFAWRNNGAKNPNRNNRDAHYGLSNEDIAAARTIAQSVEDRAGDHPTLEQVQDLVEKRLIETGYIDAARLYMTYRTQHAAKRLKHYGDVGMQEFITFTRYCRFDENLGRREVWTEAAERVRAMHSRRFKAFRQTQLTPTPGYEAAFKRAELPNTLGEAMDHAFELVAQKKVLPSMRSLQFGGKAIEASEARIYNCSYSPVNRLAFFREYFYLLLCGTGCGFSVQKRHVSQLPPLAPRTQDIDLEVLHHSIADTIEGWAYALEELIKSYIKGYKVEFNYSLIRARGTELKTSGGKAPGHIALKYSLNKIEEILQKAVGRQMMPIEVYDILMWAAKAVLSGGIRRSATICLFSADDEQMMNAKSGRMGPDGKLIHFTVDHPQRTASNNSAVISRQACTKEQFLRLFDAQKNYGEPGFYFVHDDGAADHGTDLGTNPCCEIGLNPKLIVTPADIKKLREYGYTDPVETGDVLYGWQMCNLSNVNAGAITSVEEFFHYCAAAAAIGTFQADYTVIPFLGPVTRVINEREALIGVGLCGILQRPKILLDPEILRKGAETVKAVNTAIAHAIGINPAARTTTVKPDGTTALTLQTSSGIAPTHAPHYFRRVQVNNADPAYRYFKRFNPAMCQKSVYDQTGATEVITFPIAAPKGAICRDDVDALTHLQYVKLLQENWVIPGRAYATYSDVHHNVSNTINVNADELDNVAEFIWCNRHLFTGIALLSQSGDKDYAQAPNEAITTDADVQIWNQLNPVPVDFTKMAEFEKESVSAGHEHRGAAAACSGGACEIV